MITLADVQGHWRRDWLKAPGFSDTTTHVHWMQCGTLFADMDSSDDGTLYAEDGRAHV